MSQPELGKKLNAVSTDNLVGLLKRVPTSNNLFVPCRELSPLLNYLTPFLNLKAAGNFEKILWLDALAESQDLHSIIESYSLIILIRPHDLDLLLFSTLWSKVKHNTRITLIVQNLQRSFYYQLANQTFNKNLLLERIANIDESLTTFDISNNVLLMNWKTYPICTQDFVFSIDMDYGGLPLYFNNPLQHVSKLSDAVVDILRYTTSQDNMLKLKNAFAKGDHSSLLLNNLLENKIPEMLSESLNWGEQEFYLNALRGNTDLVVLERNLDYFPLLLSHTNYLGFLDDIIGTKDEFNNELNNNVKLQDETYSMLKHINVSSIESLLKDAAKSLRSEREKLEEKNKTTTQTSDLKGYLNDVNALDSRNKEFEKYINLIGEAFGKFDSNKSGNEKYDMAKEWLGIQNNLFDNDYKNRLASVFLLINEFSSFERVVTLVVLVSLSSDGIFQSDFDKIELEIAIHYGLGSALTLKNLKEYNLIRVNENSSFLANFQFGRTETVSTSTEGTPAAPGAINEERNYDDISLLGLTGGQDVYKSTYTYTLISKMWNLHPPDDNQVIAKSIEDYTLPNFTLASNTVPLTNRIVESLYFREFLTYSPVNNIYRRPNWKKLNLDTMIKGQTIDENLCDDLDDRKSLLTTGLKEEYVIVVLVGGITRSEISLFQHLQNRLRIKKKTLLVVTSGLVNNRKLLRTMSTIE